MRELTKTAQLLPEQTAANARAGSTWGPERIFLAVLLAVGFLPLAGMMLGFRLPYGPIEHRALEQMPLLTASGLTDASYFSGVSKYFDDHFGFREALIGLKSDADALLLRKTRSDLMIGEDGFTFYISFAQQYTQY